MIFVEVPDTPDWNPLLKRLPAEWCADFMYMGHIGPVHLYKHIVTRRYLNLDSEGNCYVWNGQDDDAAAYLPADFMQQLDQATGGV